MEDRVVFLGQQHQADSISQISSALLNQVVLVCQFHKVATGLAEEAHNTTCLHTAVGPQNDGPKVLCGRSQQLHIAVWHTLVAPLASSTSCRTASGDGPCYGAGRRRRLRQSTSLSRRLVLSHVSLLGRQMSVDGHRGIAGGPPCRGGRCGSDGVDYSSGWSVDRIVWLDVRQAVSITWHTRGASVVVAVVIVGLQDFRWWDMWAAVSSMSCGCRFCGPRTRRRVVSRLRKQKRQAVCPDRSSL